jgi:hypothetical protein
MTLVTIIVPSYNYARYLEACVNSVLSQEGVDVDVLVLDDHSIDETPDICRKLAAQDPRVRYVRHNSNMGHIATYNEGLGNCRGKYLLLLSADDLLTPGSLSRATSLMEREPGIGFTFGNVIDLQPDGSVIRSYPLGKSGQGLSHRTFTGPEFIRLTGATNIVPTPTAVVRSSLQQKVGGYNPTLTHTGDMEMWLRLASHASVGFINSEQGIYRRHSSNMSLAYTAESRLPDLRQRKMALDVLFDHAGPHLAADPASKAFLLDDLGRVALWQAGMAFNQSHLAAADAISSFALSVSPKVRISSAGAKLAIKRMIGIRNWRTLNMLLRMATGKTV